MGTQTLKDSQIAPKHVAIIMDGNGRWAKARGLPRAMGHKHGVEIVRYREPCCRSAFHVMCLWRVPSRNSVAGDGRTPKEKKNANSCFIFWAAKGVDVLPQCARTSFGQCAGIQC